MFGSGEIVRNLEPEGTRSVMVTKIEGLWPTKADFKRMWKPILRGTALGSVLGILPGSGSILGSFASYSLEKALSKTPEEFGKVMHTALITAKPKVRYTVSPDSFQVFMSERVLSKRGLDRIVGKRLGLLPE